MSIGLRDVTLIAAQLHRYGTGCYQVTRAIKNGCPVETAELRAWWTACPQHLEEMRKAAEQEFGAFRIERVEAEDTEGCVFCWFENWLEGL